MLDNIDEVPGCTGTAHFSFLLFFFGCDSHSAGRPCMRAILVPSGLALGIGPCCGHSDGSFS